MTRDTILDRLTTIGREIARSADPSFYSHEYRDRAARHEPELRAARAAWKAIRRGADPAETLAWLLNRVRGIPCNRVRRLLEEVRA